MSHSTDISPSLNSTNKHLICNVLTTATKCRKNLPQILAVMIKNVLLIGCGMSLGFPTVLIGGLEDAQYDFQITQDQLSWIGAINLIFVPVGCLMSGPYCEKFGRKRAMQMATVPMALVWLLFRYSSSVWHLYAGLAGNGILLGLIEAPIVTYASEVTTPNLRGVLFSTSTLFSILGSLVAFVLGSIYYWRSVAQIAFLAPLIALNLFFLIPESPHWLIKTERFDAAQASLAWLRGWVAKEEVHQEYAALNALIRKHSSAARSASSYASSSFVKPYLLVTVVFFLRHFSGITNVQTYAVEIFQHLHAPMDKYKATTLMGVFELLGCVTFACLVRTMGKRKLALGTMALSTLALSTIPIYGYGSLGKDRNWIPMGGLLAYCFFQHCCLRTLPWVLIGEVYTPQQRAVASGVSAATGYAFGFLANKMYFGLVRAFTLNGLFVIYMAVLLLGVATLFCIMPETEGKTFDEICDYFASRKARNCTANDNERGERNNNKDIQLYRSTSRGNCYNSGAFVQVDTNCNENEGSNNKRRVRRPTSRDDYLISLDRLDSNLLEPSYKRFDETADEL